MANLATKTLLPALHKKERCGYNCEICLGFREDYPGRVRRGDVPVSDRYGDEARCPEDFSLH